MADDHMTDPEKRLPESHFPLPELSAEEPATVSAEKYRAVQATAEFVELKRRFRRFAFPMTAVFLIWYFAYVILSMYARDFMSTPMIGKLNVGMVMGLAQFVTTFILTWVYIRFMNRSIDPLSSKLRAELEGGAK